jgi:hypothetical protein
MKNFTLPQELRDNIVRGFSNQLFTPSQWHYIFQVIEALNWLEEIKEVVKEEVKEEPKKKKDV